MAQHNQLGKEGEDLAVNFLKEHGYQIRSRNFRYDKAEIDILAIVEVKTRSTDDFGNPQDFVKPKQIKNLVKAVDAYINEEALDLEVRFDIIAIVKNKDELRIEHLKDAFYHF
jgi:putative endonuclease